MRTTRRFEHLLVRLPHAYRGIHVHWPHRSGARRRLLFERMQRTAHHDIAVLLALLLAFCALALTAVWMSQNVADAITIADACNGKCEPTVIHVAR